VTAIACCPVTNAVLFCLQTFFGWSSFLRSYCKLNKSQSGVDIGVDLQLLSELDKTSGQSAASNSGSKCSQRRKPDGTQCDQNFSSAREGARVLSESYESPASTEVVASSRF